jgi:hypothetical protein
LLTRDPEIVQKSLLVQVGREFADIAFHTDMASIHLFRNPYFQGFEKESLLIWHGVHASPNGNLFIICAQKSRVQGFEKVY